MRMMMWFREDLRISDNTALYYASRAAKNGLIAVYVISPQDWRQHTVAANRVDFILRNLHVLAESLEALNIPLVILHAEFSKKIPQLLLDFAENNQVNSLYFNQQYEIDEIRRDEKIVTLFRKNKIQVNFYTDQVVIAPGQVLTAAGNFYSIFTPFKKTWLKKVKEMGQIQVLPKPKKQNLIDVVTSVIPQQIPGFQVTLDSKLWPAGEQEAKLRLRQFIKSQIMDYDKTRDFPAKNGTSCLSPYLAAGVLSPRQCFTSAQKINRGQLSVGKKGVVTWVNELIWREYYKHVLFGFPWVSKNRPFKLATEKIVWNTNLEQFKLWCEGRTGFPIVDAAMRQLKELGWMHNRLRMIVAMFLVKDLGIDWRLGEHYFMQHLIDGDLAANNGGWQWAASTGTDAAPYFRIFNPMTQSKRFDPEGMFIKQYCPELAALNAKEIHEPAKSKIALDYPQPIVDHRAARERILKMFKIDMGDGRPVF